MTALPFPQNQHKPRSLFRRELLPTSATYYKSQGIKLTGGSEWKKAHCPFHPDNKRSLLVRLDSGGFLCRSCRAHGGDVVDFHMQLYGMDFVAAAKDLGAWGYDHD
jgi:hypothetical protein